MSVLDLQAMEAPQGGSLGCGGGSSASGHSCPSTLSVALCDGTSGLSALLCH